LLRRKWQRKRNGLALCQNRHMLHRLIVIAVTLLSGFAGGQAVAQEAIGAVSRIQGEASGTRGGTTRALGLNASVFLNEVVSTGKAARLEVTFTDNTRLTLGEKAELTLDTYVFNSAAGSGTIKFGVLPISLRPGVEAGELCRQRDDAGRDRRHPQDGILGRADRRSGRSACFLSKVP
jgi:hypothetical protein